MHLRYVAQVRVSLALFRLAPPNTHKGSVALRILRTPRDASGAAHRPKPRLPRPVASDAGQPPLADGLPAAAASSSLTGGDGGGGGGGGGGGAAQALVLPEVALAVPAAASEDVRSLVASVRPVNCHLLHAEDAPPLCA